jgi:hypothetical protein
MVDLGGREPFDAARPSEDQRRIIQVQRIDRRGTFLGLCLLAAACGGGNEKKAEEPKSENERISEEAKNISDSEAEEMLSEYDAKFDEEFAANILKRGARKAEECGKSANAPSGEGEVEVVFDGQKGRVTDVVLAYPWADAPEGAQACLKNAFLDEKVPPFEGTHKVTQKVVVPEAAPENNEKKK